VYWRSDFAAIADHVDDDAAPARSHAFDQGIDHMDIAEELCVHRRAPGGRIEIVRRRAFAAPAELTRMSIVPTSRSTASIMRAAASAEVKSAA
jgi:hypothetical protein